MQRIIIARSKNEDLPEEFRKALNLLHDAGFEARPGTKLLTRYAIVVVDARASAAALGTLQAANFTASVDSKQPIPLVQETRTTFALDGRS
jgi:hypothetical protein